MSVRSHFTICWRKLMIFKKIGLTPFLICFVFLALAYADKKGPANPEESIFFPAPPDTPRIQYLTRISTSTDITGKRSGILKYILGEEESKPIIKPYGIAVRRGKIYICDTILGGLEIIDLEKKTFDYFVPRGQGQLKKPINCAVDENGYLYVADSERGQIVVFDDQNKYVASIGRPENSRPTDVAVLKDKIYVCNLSTRKIESYQKSSMSRIASFPESSTKDPGYLFSPTNLFVTENKIYVSDLGDFKIKIYDLSGEYLSSIGGFGKSIGQFVRPKGIAVDRDENLYVADAGFENTQIFNSDGDLLMFFGGSYKGPGNMWLPAKVAVDYHNLEHFRKYVDKRFSLKYLIYVTNQYGPDKISIYGFIEPR